MGLHPGGREHLVGEGGGGQIGALLQDLQPGAAAPLEVRHLEHAGVRPAADLHLFEHPEHLQRGAARGVPPAVEARLRGL
ncbi:MAG: hypothetical protein ACK559_00890, partial [bacterium]